VPIPVPGVDNVVAVAVGIDFTLALRKDGTVLAWGDGSLDRSNFAGGNGPAMHTEDATPWTAKPITIPGLANVVAISAGSGGLALLADGTARGWGYNGHYGLGLGRNVEYPKGLQSWKLPPIAGVAAALNSSYFILRDGSVLHAGAIRAGYHKVPTMIIPGS
jgi:alpha-tubulin suppressor-like RCC1 family protein